MSPKIHVHNLSYRVSHDSNHKTSHDLQVNHVTTLHDSHRYDAVRRNITDKYAEIEQQLVDEFIEAHRSLDTKRMKQYAGALQVFPYVSRRGPALRMRVLYIVCVFALIVCATCKSMPFYIIALLCPIAMSTSGRLQAKHA